MYVYAVWVLGCSYLLSIIMIFCLFDTVST